MLGGFTLSSYLLKEERSLVSSLLTKFEGLQDGWTLFVGYLWSQLVCYVFLYPFQRHLSFFSSSGQTVNLRVKRKSATYGMHFPTLVDSMW
jgi:hypothetical protein